MEAARERGPAPDGEGRSRRTARRAAGIEFFRANTTGLPGDVVICARQENRTPAATVGARVSFFVGRSKARRVVLNGRTVFSKCSAAPSAAKVFSGRARKGGSLLNSFNSQLIKGSRCPVLVAAV